MEAKFTLGWYILKEHIRSFVKKHTLTCFFLVILFAIAIFKFTSSITFGENFYKLIGDLPKGINLFMVNDVQVQSIIKTMLSTFTVLVSLLSAIYVFTFREQKSVAPSASTDNSKNALLLKVLYLVIFNLTFSIFIIVYYIGRLETKNNGSNLMVTKEMFLSILVLIFMVIIFIHNIIQFIKYLFRTMSLDSMLRDSIDTTSKQLDLIILINKIEKEDRRNKHLQREYLKLHFLLESVFQNLKFVAENNMNKEFEVNIKEFKKIFGKLEKSNGQEIHEASALLKNSPEEFMQLYYSLLRNNTSLIANIFQNQQYNKAKKAMDLHFHMYIRTEDILKQVFIISLSDMLDVIDVKEPTQISIFLDNLSNIPEEKRFLPYKYLLMKMIHNDQLINITNAIYDFKVDDKIYEKSLLIILLQNLIKSIEVSNYKITGFLVKYLITNYSGKEINKVLKVLKVKKDLFTSAIEDYEDSNLGVKVAGINQKEERYTLKTNTQIFDYCLNKAYILLYAQHKYSLLHNLWFCKGRGETGSEITVELHFKDINYSHYIIDKVQLVSSKYGLRCLENQEVLQSLNLAIQGNNLDNNVVTVQSEENLSIMDFIQLFLKRVLLEYQK